MLASSWHKAAVVGLPGGAKPFEVDFRHELVKRVRRKIEAESFQEVGCPASGLCRVVGVAALCQTTFAPLGAPASCWSQRGERWALCCREALDPCRPTRTPAVNTSL